MEIDEQELQALKDEKEALAAENKRLADEKSELEKSKGGIPKARLDQEIEKRKGAESELKDIAEELKADIPEEFQDLIPDLPPSKLIKWIRSANAKGLFDPRTEEEIKELDKKRASQKKTEELDSLSPYDKIARGYKT